MKIMCFTTEQGNLHFQQYIEISRDPIKFDQIQSKIILSKLNKVKLKLKYVESNLKLVKSIRNKSN